AALAGRSTLAVAAGALAGFRLCFGFAADVLRERFADIIDLVEPPGLVPADVPLVTFWSDQLPLTNRHDASIFPAKRESNQKPPKRFRILEVQSRRQARPILHAASFLGSA